MMIKNIMLATALFCSIGQVFAHSSGGHHGAASCHKHSDQKIAHCH